MHRQRALAAVLAATAMAASLLAQGRGPDWSRIRTAVAAILGWKVAVPLDGFGRMTFVESLKAQNELFVRNVVGSGSQQVSAEIPKNFDYKLTPEELASVMQSLRSANQRLVAYKAPSLSGDEAEARKLFEFAKALNVETIIASPALAALPMADKLANEFGVNLAIPNREPPYSDAGVLNQALAGRSQRIGVCADTGAWMEAGIKPLEALSKTRERLIAVELRDRSSLGKTGRNVPLGTGAGGIAQFLDAVYRMGITPSVISAVSPDGSGSSESLKKSYDLLEQMLYPLAADRVAHIGRTTPNRGPERMRAQDRDRLIAGIHAAVPAAAQARPKKARRLLVLDLNVAYPGHASIPAGNLAIRLWGEKTGAYEAVFSNDLDNLKYPRIQEFDAVFLNNTVGQIFPDPLVREGLMRFIREGGGLGGYHGAPHASIDWTEFGDMLAARAGSHRSPQEKVTVKIDDPASPITAVFEGKEFEFTDEFFRFTTPPYSRHKVRVLLSFNTEKTDLHQLPNCDICIRPDNDYPVAWIRSFGSGRIFYATVGHSPTIFETPAMTKFFLAGIQFVLGDLEADTTPSAR